MQVRCSLCGGESEIHPGQKMLSCSYCGSSLAVEERSGPEHLILPHERNDRFAEEAVRSLLARRKLAAPKDLAAEFFYLPYLMIKDDRGKMRTVPAPGAPSWALPLPYPPAGNFCFFDPDLAGEGKVVEAKEVPDEAHRILHLPVYRVRYRAAGKKFSAVVSGESLLVVADAYPPERPQSLSMPNILAAAALFVLLMFAGKIAQGHVGRFLMISILASAGYAGFMLRERMIRNAG